MSGLDISVAGGTIAGLIGPNGAGKSTAIKMLVGLLTPDEGDVRICGYSMHSHAVQAKQQLGYVPEIPALFDSLGVLDCLEVCAALYGMRPEAARTRSQEVLALFDMWNVAEKLVSELSKGFRQRVAICAALMHRPRVLILDEVFDALDLKACAVVSSVVREVASSGGAVLVASHLLHAIQELCTVVCVVSAGRKVAEGTPDQICRRIGARTFEEAILTLT